MANADDTIERLRNDDPSLTEVRLNGKGLQDDDARRIANALRENTSVTRIGLINNQIGDKGAQCLANAMGENTTITSIGLGDNQISDEGIHSWGKALCENTTLTKLVLTDNHISDEGARSLADALRGNTTLTWIGLQDNQIGDAGAEFLADALPDNTTLTGLGLLGNPIGDDGAQCLANALRVNTTLTLIGLESNETIDQSLLNDINQLCRENKNGAGRRAEGELEHRIDSAVNHAIAYIFTARCPECDEILSEMECYQRNAIQCPECGQYLCTWCFEEAANQTSAEYCASRCAMEFDADKDEDENHKDCIRRHREIALEDYLQTLSKDVRREVVKKLSVEATKNGLRIPFT